MVSGVAVKQMSPVIDTSAITKQMDSASRRRFSFFKRSGSNASTASTTSSKSSKPTVSYYSAPNRSVRFARKQDIHLLPSMSPQDKTNMHYSKPELQAITAEMIQTIIMSQQGVQVHKENRCIRGLESTQSQLTDKAITIARAKYLKSVVTEYRILKRSSRKVTKDEMAEKLRSFSLEQTAKDREESVRLGKVDASAAGVTVYTPSVQSTKYAVSPRPTSYTPKNSRESVLEIEAVLSDDDDDAVEC